MLPSLTWLLASVGLLASLSVAAGGFSKSCLLSGANLVDKRHLGTTCQNEKYEIYGYNYTVIDLDKCIANRHGRLELAPNGRFSGSCHQCRFHEKSETGDFSCRCSDGNGNLKDESTVQLDKEVFNRNGAMGCYDYVGTKTRCKACKN